MEVKIGPIHLYPQGLTSRQCSLLPNYLEHSFCILFVHTQRADIDFDAKYVKRYNYVKSCPFTGPQNQNLKLDQLDLLFPQKNLYFVVRFSL